MRVHFGPLASAAIMRSHDSVVPWLHRTRRQVGSKYNSELSSPTFYVSSSFSSTSFLLLLLLLLLFLLLLFESCASLSPSAHPGAVPVTLSLLPAMCSSKNSPDGIGSSCSGRLTPKPNLNSVNNTLKKFFSGL